MWGTSYAFIKLGVETLPTFTLIATRLAIGLALLATVVLVAREPLPRNPRTYFHLAVMARDQHRHPVHADHLGRAVGRLGHRGDPQRRRAADRHRPRGADLP